MDETKQKKVEKLLDLYTKKVAKEFSNLAIKKHINKHAKEIYDRNRNPEHWIASMRNLVDTYEHQCKLKPNSVLQIYKTYSKWLTNKSHYVPPPKGVDEEFFKDIGFTNSSSKKRRK